MAKIVSRDSSEDSLTKERSLFQCYEGLQDGKLVCLPCDLWNSALRESIYELYSKGVFRNKSVFINLTVYGSLALAGAKA